MYEEIYFLQNYIFFLSLLETLLNQMKRFFQNLLGLYILLWSITHRLDLERDLEAGACKSHLTSLSDFSKSVPGCRRQILPDELRYECHDTAL